MKAVAMIGLLDRRGWVLLQERDEHAPVAPEQWCLVGGAVEADETPQAAAHRELLEETGLVRDDLLWRGQHDLPCPHHGRDVVDLFTATTTLTDADVTCGEGRQIVFVDPAAAAELDLTDSTRALLPLVLGAPPVRGGPSAFPGAARREAGDEAEVVAAAEERAAALAAGDAERLSALLHERFRWTSHRGETFTRAEYVARNCGGPTTWHSQRLDRPDVVVVGPTAFLHAEVTDVVVTDGGEETFRMPMTQVWVRVDGAWQCLAGHAGPRLDARHRTDAGGTP